ncbi:MAG: phosphatidylserine decarboxylase [Acidaminococcaceae bacterium]|nr:phosphatidylserine decarboxylase [Acidaminococcaceae bacterium]
MKFWNKVCLLVLVMMLCVGNVLADDKWGKYSPPPVSGVNTAYFYNEKRADITNELIYMVEHSSKLKALLEKAIAKGKEINPDKNSNPAQTLEEYYDYIDWAATAMPWEILPYADKHYSKLYDSIDQSLNYFYFISDMPLKELAGKGLYNNSLQYIEPYRTWMIKFTALYGYFLTTTDSWNNSYYERAKKDASFHLHDGTYESPDNWRTFNDFFARYLSSPDKRPVAFPDDNSVLASPADSQPQGVWKINRKGRFVHHKDVSIKSRSFTLVEELLGDSAYKKAFAGGILTHTFLDVNDYHRYHSPVSGVIKEVKIIPSDDAIGGRTVWSPERKKYLLLASVPGWQMLETRGLVVIDTKEYGLVAVLPIAMSQVSSVCFEEKIKVGAEVKKGDMMGCFLFGGSDIVMLFQKGIKLNVTVPKNTDGNYEHIDACSQYGILSK